MRARGRFLSYIGLFALLIGLLSGLPSLAQPGAAQGSRGEFQGELADRLCPGIGPAGEIEGRTYYCGLMYVPENYDEPNGRRIQITYAVLKSKSRSPLPDPVVYLQGGPGGSTIQSITYYAKVFADLREHRDIILYDQRGTKYSSRLNCDPYLYMLNYLVDTDEEVAEIFEELVDLAGDEAMPDLIAQIYMEVCAEGFIDAGIDLTQYNSAVSVKDLFALTNALGYDEVNLLGISYGTRLALAAMRDHPQQIRSVILDSVYPPEVHGLEWFSRQFDEVLDGLVRTCENDRECNAAFPNFRRELEVLIDGFADNPRQLEGLRELLNNINYNPALAEYIPLMVYELVRGETTTLQAIIDGDLPRAEPPEDLPGLQDDLLLQAQELQETAEYLFIQAALQAQDERPGAVWMQQVAAAMEPLSREETGLAAIALMIVLMISPEPDAALLEEFVLEYLPRSARNALLRGLDELDPLELQYVYDLIEELSDELSGGRGFTDGMYYSVECNEEAHFNDLAEAEAAVARLAFPQLGGAGLALSRQIAAICEIWPSGQSDPIETEPVVSDIPTLVMVGAYDTQTPPSWGSLLMPNLSNGILVEAPASGHGVIRFSDCANDIAVAFVASPTASLNLDCLADLAPDFVTPAEAAADDGADAGRPGGDDLESDNDPGGDGEERPVRPRDED